MDEIKRAVRDGAAVPLPDFAVSDLELFTLALTSSTVGEDFKKGLLRYIRTQRIDISELRKALDFTERIQGKAWEHLFEGIRKMKPRDWDEMHFLNDETTRKLILSVVMVWWGTIGGEAGAIGTLIGASIAGYVCNLRFRHMDRARAIQECRQNIAIIRSTLPAESVIAKR